MRKLVRSKRLRRKRLHRRRPINVVASVVTTLSLYCGIAGIFSAIKGEPEKAAYWILASIFLDVLDGAVARLTKSVSSFGKELDSLSDLVSAGVAPAVLIYTAYLRDWESFGTMLGIVFVICGALRLARYNVYQAERRDYFIGLPIPAAGGTLAAFVLFAQYWQMEVAPWVLTPLTLGLSGLMVSTVRYPKDKLRMLILAPKHAFRFLVLCVLGIAVFHYARAYSPAIVLLPLALAYVLFGIGDEFYMRLYRRAAIPEAPQRNEAGETPQPAPSATPSDVRAPK